MGASENKFAGRYMRYILISIFVPLLLWYRIVDTETLIWRMIYFIAGIMFIDWMVCEIIKEIKLRKDLKAKK